jgi:hypothetical protein
MPALTRQEASVCTYNHANHVNKNTYIQASIVSTGDGGGVDRASAGTDAGAEGGAIVPLAEARVMHTPVEGHGEGYGEDGCGREALSRCGSQLEVEGIELQHVTSDALTDPPKAGVS